MFTKSFRRASLFHTSAIRQIATLNTNILQSSVFMPETFPAKLCVPLAKNDTFEFTVHAKDSVHDFIETAQKSCGPNLKSFDLKST